jgi:hypothetical protein
LGSFLPVSFVVFALRLVRQAADESRENTAKAKQKMMDVRPGLEEASEPKTDN